MFEYRKILIVFNELLIKIIAIMISWIKKLVKPMTRPLNRIELRRDQYLQNLLLIQQSKPWSLIIPVLKSNAYGHGLTEVCEILNDAHHISMVAVDSFPEYRVVKKHTNKKILILGETWSENYRMFDTERAVFGVYSIHTLQALIALKKKIRIHLFLNTGMNREGIQSSALADFLDMLTTAPWITLEGVMSHLSNSNDELFDTTAAQILQFKSMVKQLEEKWFHPLYKHLGASAWIVTIEDDFFNAWRVGKLSYGYSPFDTQSRWFEKTPQVKPFLDVYSTVVSVQHLKTWEGVSYGKTWKTDSDTIIATIPFWYYEGFDRRMSNAISVVCKEKIRKQVGNICMNLSSFQADEEVKVWDVVQCISSEIWSPLSIQSLADIIHTISYEVLVKLSEKVKRIIL